MHKFDFTKSKYNYYVQECCLSKEERRVLDLRRNEKSIIEISRILHLAPRTVSARIKGIYTKLLECEKQNNGN